ncbi:uncharacterized protein [Hyperolius riggenbachi]|uniref:uncharacterized protein n=1 Tax=Hyperolius riggenbachi TaxID=752182 RepID=UPI0035A268DB
MNTVKEEISNTFTAFRSALSVNQDQSQSLGQGSRSSPATSETGQEVGLAGQPSITQELRIQVSDDSGEEGAVYSDTSEKSKSLTSSRYLFSAEDTNELLKAVYDSEQLKSDLPTTSVRDDIYKGLIVQTMKVFPIHDSIKELIRSQWKDPEKRFFVPRSFKRRFPFKEEEESPWTKCPKLDAALAQYSKNSDLSFEDAGSLKDPMDRKADALLKRAWDAVSFSFKPAIASICLARNLVRWIEGLQNHLIAGTPHEKILESLPVISKSVAFLADAASENVRASAKAAALVNSSRRAVWLNAWEGDSASKHNLCSMEFQGELLFGKDLDSVLERSSDRNKKFPDRRKKIPKKPFVNKRSQSRAEATTRGGFQSKRWTYNASRGRGSFLFNRPQNPPNKQSK